MMMAMFLLAGVLLLWGFMAQWYVLQAAIDTNMLWLTIVGIVMAVIGPHYYLNVVKVMYFDEPEEGVELAPQSDGLLRWTLSLNGLALLAMTVFSGVLLDWCRQAFVG